MPLCFLADVVPARPDSASPTSQERARRAPAPRGYDYAHPEVQPAKETLDLTMYARIRDEGLNHSRVMDYATALFDDIGPRLTGSPNMAKANAWTRDQLAAMGCSNAHLESWGDFGMGWRQIATSANMAKPDTAVFIAQATPWSPATPGLITADVIAVPYFHDEKDFDKWKGKLAGKIVLYGRAPKINPSPKPLLESYDENETAADLQLSAQRRFSGAAHLPKHAQLLGRRLQAGELQGTGLEVLRGPARGCNPRLQLLAAMAALCTTTTTRRWDSASTCRITSSRSHPLVLADEAFGRISRLLEHNVPVSLALNVQTQFTGDHEQGYNTIAEIPGTDPQLKDQVVMAGGHLDSWIAGTGATDDGAGAIIAMEAMRILTALHVQPRRTIRVALWSGEEQGEFGSLGYVDQHLATIGYATTPEQLAVPTFLRTITGPITPKPDYALFSGYFNLDNGGGKLLGIYADDNAADRAHLSAVDRAAEGPRRNDGHHAAQRLVRSGQLRQRRPSRFPVHPGSARLRDAKRPQQSGHLRAALTGRPEAGSCRRSDLPLRRGHARPDASSQSVPAS